MAFDRGQSGRWLRRAARGESNAGKANNNGAAILRFGEDAL